MLVLGFFVLTLHLVHTQDLCSAIDCGSGRCQLTRNPTLPYYCRCSNGANTILPCPSENPCSRNPCGQGTCDVVPSLLNGYLCRCAGDTISLTSCNVTRSSCYSNPCINGVCIEGLTSFFCNCLPTWTGRFCDVKIVSVCSANPCHPGKCFQLGDTNIPFVCLCPNGQFAISCRDLEHPSTTARMLTSKTTRSPHTCNPLLPRTCMNGGQCLPIGMVYRCLCSTGYTGTSCEININECASNPCRHGGLCYDLQSSYICYCPDRTFRSQCSPYTTAPVATSTARTLVCPCRNGGVCTMVGTETCACPSGFTGRFCERLLPAGSCQQIQCENGGTCYENSPGSSILAYCLCKPGYTGKLCETEYFRCRSNGRFADPYNCAQGKYFECIHYQKESNSNAQGILLSRSCPASLRFNYMADRCDYVQNVQCIYV